MTRSTLAAASLLALTSCAADVPDAQELSAVASIMLVQGEVKVGHGANPPSPAQVGDLLMREDVVWTSPGAAAILHLRNNHLVRVDEDLQLNVADIVLLDAPASELDASQQLAELLYPEERQAIPGVEQAERVSGWQSRLRAGQSVGTVSEEDREEASDDAGSAAAAPAPEPEPESKPKPTAPPLETSDEDPLAGGDFDGLVGSEIGDAYGSGGLGLSGVGSGGGGTGEGMGIGTIGTGGRGGGTGKGGYGAGAANNRQAPSRSRGDKLANEPAAAPAPPPPPPAWTQDSLAAATRDPGALRTCLVSWAGTLPVKVQQVELRVTVASSRITRVSMGGGLMPPVCARDELVGDAAGVTSGQWKVVVAVE